ncbi:MAG: hypothetical protein LC623_09360 [Halobacteriales archaeon]|nr:hypothetical protein [Halobacteriales archaeon]
MRPLLVVAALALAWAPPALAVRDAGGNSSSDPAGDEAASLALPATAPAPVSCHDPSIDILSVAATARGRTLRVEVEHAAPVLVPMLACNGLPVTASGQKYGLAVGGEGDSFLYLSVDAGAACLYVLFQEPVQVSDCIQAAQVDGASITLEADLQGIVSVGEGATRLYKLGGTLVVHAFNEELGAPRPGPGLPFAPDALLRLEDHSDTDAVLTLNH